MPFNSIACVVFAAVAAALAVPTASGAAHGPDAYGPDPDAPAGAPGYWLPSDAWVMERWLPYSDAELMRQLGVDPEQVRAWLRTGRNLAALARHKRLDPRRIARQLVEPARSRVSPGYLQELRRRAWKTFTQRHLMQHLLFHTLHTRSLSKAFESALGTSWPDYHRLRARGLSLADMGARNGKSRGHVLRTFARVLRRAAAKGVRSSATTREQEHPWLRQQVEALPQYVDWRPPSASARRARKSAVRASAAAGPSQLCSLGG